MILPITKISFRLDKYKIQAEQIIDPVYIYNFKSKYSLSVITFKQRLFDLRYDATLSEILSQNGRDEILATIGDLEIREGIYLKVHPWPLN